MAKDEIKLGDTGKLATPRTSELGLGHFGTGDQVSISPGIKSDAAAVVDEPSAKLLGELYAEVARSKALLEDLQGPMVALRLALGLIAGEVPESQLFAGCSTDERDYVRALALHLVDASSYRQRVEVAMAQFSAASDQMAAVEKQIQEAAVLAQTLGTEALRDLKLEKIRGVMHPLAVLPMTFEGDYMLSALVPAAPERGLPGSGRSLSGQLAEILNPQDLARAARRMVRRAVKALLYPPPGT
jgi:hypothetical protein